MKKLKNVSPAVKASVALLIANLILKGLSMISGPVFTRMMVASEYGMVSTFYSWESLLYTIVTLNLASGVFNNGMLEFSSDRDTFEFNLLFVSVASSVCFFIIYFIFRDYFNSLFELPFTLMSIMFLNFILTPAYSYWNARQRYELKYKMLTVVMVMNAVLSLIGSVIAVAIADEGNKAIARIVSSEIVSCGFGLIFFIFIIIKSKIKLKKKYCLYALKFNIPLLPHYMSIYVLNSADRIMITKMVDTTATAIYSVAYTASMTISIVWQSIDSSLSPWIYEKLNNKETENVKEKTLKILMGYAVLCLATTLFAPEIMAILAPKEYQAGVYVIPAVTAGVFFTGIYMLYMRIELFYKNTGFATLATGVAAIVNLLTNYLFIKIFGFLAAGYTTMGCYYLLYLLHYFNVKRKGYERTLNNRGILVLSIIYSVITLSIPALYNLRIIRYVLIACIVLFVFIKRKIIIELLRIKGVL